MKAKTAKPGHKTRPLNLRDFPDDLYWKAKVCAAQQRMTLKQFVVEAVQRAIA